MADGEDPHRAIDRTKDHIAVNLCEVLTLACSSQFVTLKTQCGGILYEVDTDLFLLHLQMGSTSTSLTAAWPNTNCFLTSAVPLRLKLGSDH